MLGFLARKLLYVVPVLIAVSLLTFLIASLLPGDLAYVILGDQATPEKVTALRHEMGLDESRQDLQLGLEIPAVDQDLRAAARAPEVHVLLGDSGRVIAEAVLPNVIAGFPAHLAKASFLIPVTRGFQGLYLFPRGTVG